MGCGDWESERGEVSREITIHIATIADMLEKAGGRGYGCIGMITEDNDDLCFTDYPSACPLKEVCMTIAKQLKKE